MGLGPSLWARDVEEKNLGGDEQSPAVSGGVCSVCCKLFPRLQKGKDQGQTGAKMREKTQILIFPPCMGKLLWPVTR